MAYEWTSQTAPISAKDKHKQLSRFLNNIGPTSKSAKIVSETINGKQHVTIFYKIRVVDGSQKELQKILISD